MEWCETSQIQTLKNETMDINEMKLSFFSSLLDEEGTRTTFAHHFSPKLDNEEIFSYMWNLEKAHKHLTPKLIHSRKSEQVADKHLTDGNNFFRISDLTKALQNYNMCIMAAPHPPHQPTGCNKRNHGYCTEFNDVQMSCTHSDSQYRTLATGYANRSAVLYKLKEYRQCIADIERAKFYGYRKELNFKMTLRKAECLLFLGETSEAEWILKASLAESDSTDIENEVQVKDKLIDLLFKKCQLNGQAGCGSGSLSIDPVQSSNLSMFSRQPPLPKLQEVNPIVPVLSSAIRMDVSPVKGRILVAVDDIDPGELLCVEESYAFGLDTKSNLAILCSNCLALCPAPLPCPKCSLVIFCSESCRHQGLEGHHGRECSSILPTILSLGEGNLVVLYRIMTKISYTKMKQLIPKLQQEIRDLTPICRGFNAKGIYDSHDHRTVFHLVSNKEEAEPLKILEYCATAFILTKIFEQSQQFFLNERKEPFTPTLDDLLLTGSTLMHHLLCLSQNGFKLNTFQENGKTSIGGAIFPAMSLCSHSCNPSAMFLNHGKYGVMRAVRSIPAGSEVTLSYGPSFLIESLDTRRKELRIQWSFDCSCEACINDWPTNSCLPEDIILKCINCHRPLEWEDQCTKCLGFSENQQNLQVKLDLETFISQFNTLHDQNYDKSHMLKIASNIIKLMDKYSQTLCKFYYDVQNILKNILFQTGAPFLQKGYALHS